MEQISAFEAKTHLSRLLKRVQQGEKITISRHGVPVAILSPAEKGTTHEIPVLINELDELRRRTKPGAESIKDMIEEGRRF